MISEDGVGGAEEEVLEVDVELQLGEYIDGLTDKK